MTPPEGLLIVERSHKWAQTTEGRKAQKRKKKPPASHEPQHARFHAEPTSNTPRRTARTPAHCYVNISFHPLGKGCGRPSALGSWCILTCRRRVVLGEREADVTSPPLPMCTFKVAETLLRLVREGGRCRRVIRSTSCPPLRWSSPRGYGRWAAGEHDGRTGWQLFFVSHPLVQPRLSGSRLQLRRAARQICYLFSRRKKQPLNRK